MRSRLATNRGGRVRVSPHVPRKPVDVRGRTINLRSRLERHERVELEHMRKGASYREAHEEALKAERGDMTKKEWLTYNAILGSIAQKKPWRFE